MKAAKFAIGSFVVGAAAMYFGDPRRGRRRRVIVRDKVNSVWHGLLREFDKAGRDFQNRSQGVTSAVRGLRNSDEAPEQVIVERVRACIGRAVSHPHAISVSTEPGGRVVLDGLILDHEVQRFLKKVWAVPGVTEVIDRLESHREPGNVASLQGGRPRGANSVLGRESWTPVLRVAAGAVGAGALVRSLRQEGMRSFAGAIAGGALLARAVANKDLPQVLGIRGSDAFHFDKTIHIIAPVQEVFGFWSNFENFPRFMAHLKEVRDLGDGRSRWVALGPGGIPTPWEAKITDRKENELLAWESVDGSMVNSTGRVRFSPQPDGGTNVHIRMSYCPPAGVLGHGIAWLFGADPKSEMDDDLVRLKSLIEVGKTRAHGSTVWRDDLLPSPL